VSAWTRSASRPFSARDAEAVRSLGFDFIRLQVDPVVLVRDGGPADSLLDEIRATVSFVNAAGLAVIADVHPTDEFKLAALSEPAAFDSLVRGLALLARALSRRSPDSVAIELLNEPVRPRHLQREWNWDSIQRTLWHVARREAPYLTVVATGDRGSSIDGLLAALPLPDSNVVYTFHYYLPYLFTHQGASWGYWASTFHPWLREVPYPSSPDRVQGRLERSLGSAPDSATRAAIAAALSRYGEERWQRSRVLTDVRRAADWARSHGVRVVAGEFGAFSNFALPEDRLAWLRDVRSALEELGVGWALWRLWDYGEGFGLLRRDGSPDESVLAALGLTRLR